MCGISFLLTTDVYNSKAEDFLKQSLLVNQVRGMHSSGIYQVGTDNKISFFKQAVNASTFIDINDAKTLLGKAARSRLTVTHVRHATQGAADKTENAHPFRVVRDDGTEVIVVHNGSLRGWKNKKNSKDIDVDSAWAAQMIADEGEDAFQYFDGPYAFVWYDTATPDVFYMCRNKERPLHYALSEDRKTMYGMSELGSLGWLIGRNDIKRDKEGYFFLDPGTIYEFSLKQPGDSRSWKAPAYDPRTTLASPPAPRSHIYDEADWGDGVYGLHPSQSFRPRQGGAQRWNPDTRQWEAVGAVDYREEETSRILTLVKQALKAARNASPEGSDEADQNSPIIDQEVLDRELEAGIQHAINNWSKPKSLNGLVPLSSFSAPMFVTNVDDRECTREEISTCQNARLYGQVVDFTPILYDETEESVYGNAEIFENGKWVEQEVILRGIGPRKGLRFYDPSRGFHRVTICGIDDRSSMRLPPALLISELFKSTKALILSRVGKLSAAN